MPTALCPSAKLTAKASNDKPGYTFFPFKNLPAELRFQIWELSMEPRTVKLSCTHRTSAPGQPRRVKLSSPNATPAALQACRESRNHLSSIYSKVLLKHGDWKCTEPPMLGAHGWRNQTPQWEVTDETTQGHVFLNWNVDTVDIGKNLLACFQSIAPSVKALKLERDNGDECWYRSDSQKLQAFNQVETIHVMVAPDQVADDWHATSDAYPWPCSNENILITDRHRTMTLKHVEAMCDRNLEGFYRMADPESRVTVHNGKVYDPDDPFSPAPHHT
ncbi:hypothetical protein E8E13_010372 [Curvularia kusanoi]|uniref:2EXR domain-containing protein n=1 Tax=Curvularia kusanoi TaxID=90978 RepID=A0A9P4TGK0_CURKU|nr:hypothetical protein E8E13_010372 [Curvularia kusanoi]